MNLSREVGRREVPRPPSAKTLAPAARPTLVELVPAAHPPITSARYLLHVGALRLEIADDFDPHTLRRLLAVLRAC